jgi:restriction system protein
MAIPDFQSLMLPLLTVAGDRQEHSLSEAIDTLAVQCTLTDEERKELLPSGRQAKFDNRVGWVVTHLKKARLLESTGRGRFRITDRGIEVLRNRPTRIDLRFLNQFPEFVEFRNLARQERPEVEEVETSERTPEEILEASYLALRQNLQQELLELVKTCSPKFFENLVVDLLVTMGYGGSRKDAGQAIGQTGDGGIDGIIKEDRLGLDVVYIQAKRWQGTIGRPEVQAFAGSLEGERARKGVFITTSRFTPSALDYVSRIEKKIVLIDGQQLAQFMVDYDIGVTEMARYVVKKIDLDYFSEE